MLFLLGQEARIWNQSWAYASLLSVGTCCRRIWQILVILWSLSLATSIHEEMIFPIFNVFESLQKLFYLSYFFVCSEKIESAQLLSAITENTVSWKLTILYISLRLTYSNLQKIPSCLWPQALIILVRAHCHLWNGISFIYINFFIPYLRNIYIFGLPKSLSGH